MNYKKTIKIFTNLALLASFLLTYFLDLTGLELHQYLGIAAAGILAIHIITHWEWVEKVSEHIFSKVSGRVRVYYLLDGMLLLSFFLITITGVLISTWLDIFLSNYLLLRSIHIFYSIVGLLLLIVKMGLHWKFFVKVFSPVRFSMKKAPATSVNSGVVYSRRDALKTIGIISAVGIFGVYKAASAVIIPKSTATLLPEVKTSTDAPAVSQATAPAAAITPQEEPITQTAHTGGGQKRGRRNSSSLQENLSQPASEQTPEQTLPQPSQEILPDNPQEFNIPIEDCVVRCDRGCAFPGLCRRYTDQNQNQLCDLGECLPV